MDNVPCQWLSVKEHDSVACVESLISKFNACVSSRSYQVSSMITLESRKSNTYGI